MPLEPIDGSYIHGYIRIRFSWDARKSDATLRTRGFDFASALLIFRGRTLEHEDTRRDYGERRVVATGLANDTELTVCYTDLAVPGQEMERRIISAWRSNRRERQAYWQASELPV